MIAPETLRDEERPDDFEAFGLLDDVEVLVEELDVPSVFPVELDFDNNSDPLVGIEENGIGLSTGSSFDILVPRLDEKLPIRQEPRMISPQVTINTAMIVQATFLTPFRFAVVTRPDPHVVDRLADPPARWYHCSAPSAPGLPAPS